MIAETLTFIGLVFFGKKLKNKSSIGRISGRRWFGGNSGYYGYSKSVRAVQAEERGLKNLSQMDKAFAEEVSEILGRKVTLKEIKEAIHDGTIEPDEWHHTSKYGNRTNYYSAESVAAALDYEDVPAQTYIRDVVPLEEVLYYKKRPYRGYVKEYRGYAFRASNGVLLIVQPTYDIDFCLSKESSYFSFILENGGEVYDGYAVKENYSSYGYTNSEELRKKLEQAVSELKKELQRFVNSK